jgi:hypothetical protein
VGQIGAGSNVQLLKNNGFGVLQDCSFAGCSSFSDSYPQVSMLALDVG